MLKLLDKSIRILELITEASPESVKTGEISEKLDINLATCSRILKDLAQAGYVECISRDKGYIAGVRSYVFGQHVNYKKDLLETASPILKQLAEKWSASIILVEIKNLSRFIIMHHNFHPVTKVDIKKICYDDLFDTATGLLLMSYCQDSIREDFLNEYKTTQETLYMPENEDELHEFMNNTRKKGQLYYKRDNGSEIFAVPLFYGSTMPIAIGATFFDNQKVDKEAFLSELKNISREIRANLNRTTPIG